MNPIRKYNKFGNYLNINIDVDCGINDTGINYSNIHYNLNKVIKSYKTIIPRFLQFLNSHNCKATFFIVAKTAKNNEVKIIIKDIFNNGHEIASHSYSHDKNLHLKSFNQIDYDLYRSKDILENTIGSKVLGFRSPGYAMSRNVYRSLIKNNFKYSSSLNGSIIYNISKILYKYFISDIESRNIYNVDFNYLNYSRKKFTFYNFPKVLNNKYSQIDEIPISTDFSKLFNSTTWSNLYILRRFFNFYYTNILPIYNRNLNIGFHDFEFSKNTDYDNDGFVTRTENMMLSIPFNQRINSYNSIIRSLKKKYIILLLKDLISIN